MSQERLAEAIGVDVSTVARWERGQTEPHAAHRPRLAKALKVSVEEVAELLTSQGVPATVPAFVAPFGLAELPPTGEASGEQATPPYAWGALRTLEDLAVFVRSDMLTRRDVLSASVSMAAGAALTGSVASWLNAAPGGLPAAKGHGLGKVGMSAVEGIEHAIRLLRELDASAGGGVAREAAVGQLKYAVDLAQHGSYSQTVGTRLLTAIADLSGSIGWMSHDAGMDGPAQRYFWYGIRAAHEAGTERAQLRCVGILADMGRQMQAIGHLSTASQLVDLALDRVPDGRHRYNAVRAMLWSRKANVMSAMEAGSRTDVHRHIGHSFDLYHHAADDEPSPAMADYFPYSSDADAELASEAAVTYHVLAKEDARLVSRAEQYALRALESRSEGFTRSRVFDQVMLARTGLRAGELERACRDGREAIRMAGEVGESQRVRARLRQLMEDTSPHRREPAVRELREELQLAGVA